MRKIIGLAIAATLTLGACGSDNKDDRCGGIYLP